MNNNRVNEAVAHTLRQPHQRSNFYFYNNGIIITCSQFRHNALQKDNWRVQVSNMQIVNGGQTAHTVQQVAQQIGSEAIETAEVLVRIYELQQDDNDLIDAITLAINSQTPVQIRDLKANKPKQKALARSISLLGYIFLAYGSRFMAMLIGRYLLQDMGINLAHLAHRNFHRAQELIQNNLSSYLSRAEEAISTVLESFYNGPEPTLQRLSATFRRVDLVEMLLHVPEDIAGTPSGSS